MTLNSVWLHSMSLYCLSADRWFYQSVVDLLISKTAHAGTCLQTLHNLALNIFSRQHIVSVNSNGRSGLQRSSEPFKVPFGWRGLWKKWIIHFLIELRVYWSECFLQSWGMIYNSGGLRLPTSILNCFSPGSFVFFLSFFYDVLSG